MKKRALSLLLALVCLVCLLSPAVSAAAPVAKPHTVTKSVNTEFGPATVSITYTRWYGEIESKYSGLPNAYTQVIEANSEIRFTISAADPRAYYNFVYDKGEFEWYDFDDCGGGSWHHYDISSGSFDYPCFVMPNGDGSARYVAATNTVATCKKLAANSYVLTVKEGAMTPAFSLKTIEDNLCSYGIYNLGTILAVTPEQLDDVRAGKAPTFYAGTMFEHSYVFPGLAAMFGAEEPEPMYPGFGIYFSDSSSRYYDDGICYTYSIQNNTEEAMTGPYVLAFFRTEKETSAHYPTLELFSFDLALEPGDRIDSQLISKLGSLSRMEMVWIRFEDEAERAEFLADDRLIRDNTSGSYALDYGNTVKISVEEADAWFKDYLGITITAKG